VQQSAIAHPDERNKLLLTRAHFPLLYPLVVLVTFCLTFDYLIRSNLRVFAAGWRNRCAGLRCEAGRPTRVSLCKSPS